MVAEDLVQLDEVAGALLEPRREPFVQLGAGGLGERIIGGVSDQQVAEAEGIVPGELCRIGAHELFAHERRERRRHLPIARERLDRRSVEELALDGPAPEQGSLRLVELVESSAEQRLEVGRDSHVAF